jgi:hypothetical protein
MFTLVLNTGQIAAALSAVCVFAFGIWKYVIRPARKVVKMSNSVGDNGKETVFQLLHGISEKMNDLTSWRQSVDQTLAHQNLTLYQQNRDMDALSVSMDALLERDDKR